MSIGELHEKSHRLYREHCCGRDPLNKYMLSARHWGKVVNKVEKVLAFVEVIKSTESQSPYL